jgi:hypothetical protein
MFSYAFFLLISTWELIQAVFSVCTVLIQYVLRRYVRGPFEKFVDWRQLAAVMQREAVTVMPICSGGGNVVVA